MESINIKTLTLSELTGVVNLYPWYGAARKELCIRMMKIGGDTWGKKDFADAALYLGSRAIVANIFRMKNVEDYSDKNVEELVRSCIQDVPAQENAPVSYERTVRVIGGDYFTQSEYDQIKHTEDNVFSNMARNIHSEKEKNVSGMDTSDEFCTETLAKIYTEQCYYEQAKNIYSKLLLKNPEKSAYFASLLGEIEKLINN